MPDDLPPLVDPAVDAAHARARGLRLALAAAVLALLVSAAGAAIVWSNGRSDLSDARAQLADVQLQNDDLNRKLTVLVEAVHQQSVAQAQTTKLTACRVKNSTDVDVFLLGYFRRLLVPPVDVNAMLTELDAIIARRAAQGQVAGEGLAAECPS